MKNNITDIAIIGMAGKYSKSDTHYELWDNILKNKDLFSSLNNTNFKKNYVNKYFPLNDVDLFDNKFFGFTPQEASLTDPQQRFLLTCAYHALEDAGYTKEPENSKIGVFATSSSSSYLFNVLLKSKHYKKDEVNYPIMIGNFNDFLATKIAYKLNLTGPAITIQCACSSSLVALHYGCQSLLNGECDIAVVGGVSISIPQKQGYYHVESGIFSKDGICRPFDENATGTIKGNGCSVVVLKRLENSINDNDKIYAVVKGTAINNDGSSKIGYTAPSISGESSAIKEALSMSELKVDDIGYIETHGTATELGDLIELTALNKVFANTVNKIFLGSIKANIGHLDVAAGLTSIIKAIYILNKSIIPPIKNFQKLNKKLDKVGQNFIFPTDLTQKEIQNVCVNSFGLGGTNAHAILSKYTPYDLLKTPFAYTKLNSQRFWIDNEEKNENTSFSIPEINSDKKNLLSIIIDIWTDCIGEESINPDSNYFDIGGDSLGALSIIDDINTQYGIKLNMNEFKNNLTPTTLSKLIESRMSLKKQSTFLTQIRKSKKSNLSVFLIHPAGGTTFCYNIMNQYLKGDYNLFGIDLPENYNEYSSMQNLASYYLNEIKKYQEHGPYIIGGYSFGGNLAYEIAIQLENQNQKVAKVIMFDSHPPEAYFFKQQKEINYNDVFQDVLSCYFNKKFDKITYQNKSLVEILSIMRSKKIIETQLKDEELISFYNKWIFNHKLLKNHNQKQMINTELIMFLAKEKEDITILDNLNIAYLNKNLWINRFNGKVTASSVKGNHYTMFNSDFVKPLCEEFDKVMVI